MKTFIKKKSIKIFHKGRRINKSINFKSKFELNLDEYTLGINEIFKLRPKEYTKATLEWSSDNESVAIVDNNGNITPIGLGTCDIICMKGNNKASCTLTIEEKENIINAALEAERIKIFAEDGLIKQHLRDVEQQSEIEMYGNVSVLDNKMIFDGSSYIETNGIVQRYGFGTDFTLDTQRFIVRFKIDKYPEQDKYYDIIRFEKESLRNQNGTPSKVAISHDGHIKIGTNFGSAKENLSSFTIPTGEWVDLIFCVGNSNGWSYKLIYKDIIDDFPGTGNVIWGADLTVGFNFVGEIETVRSIRIKNSTAFNEELYAPLVDYILNNNFVHIEPVINKNRIRNILDHDLNTPLTLTFELSNPDKDKNLTFADVDDITLDLEELDEDGYVTRVYKNALVYGTSSTVELVNDYEKPERWYKYFRLKDNFNKTYIDTEALGISTVDPTIEKAGNGIPGYMHIGPKKIVSRAGKYVLMQPTFAPNRCYKDPRCTWTTSDESVAVIDDSGLVTCKNEGIVTVKAVSKCNPALSAIATIIVKPALDESKFAIVDIDKYNIVSDNADLEISYNNMVNIEKAIHDYKSLGYEGCKMPQGHYYMNLEFNKQYPTITLPSDFVVDLNNSIFEHVAGNESTDIYMFSSEKADNSVLKNGTLIGDRNIHDYGTRINEYPGSYLDGYPDSIFEIGCIDHNDGVTLVEKSTIDGTLGVRTKDFITEFPEGGFSVIPLWRTTMNSVDGGRAIVYWYDDEGNYLGYKDKQFIGGKHEQLEGATKAKIVIRSEQRLDPVFTLTSRTMHNTYEFASNLLIKDCFNFEIQNITSLDCQGDCLLTHDASTNKSNAINDFRVIDSTFENSRRQGLSFVATQDNCLIKRCNIGKINGTDPQCGIDFEAYARNEKFLIDECNFYDNRKWDIVDCFSGQIEVRNSTFNGSIGLGQTSYNWYVHDNEFIYDDKYIDAEDPAVAKYKIHNGCGANLTINEPDKTKYPDYHYYSIMENNYFNGKSVGRTGGSTIGSAQSRVSKNNIAYGGSIQSAGISENDTCYPYTGSSYDLGGYYDNYRLEILSDRTDQGLSIRSKVSTFKNSEFKNCQLGGIGHFEDCTIICKDSPMGYHFTNDGGKPLYIKNCILYNNGNMKMGSGFGGCIIFEDCDMYLTRCDTSYLKYGQQIEYKNCTIHFMPGGTLNKNINWLGYGYGAGRCSNIYFENCKFITEENNPVTINNANCINCTSEGPITFENKIMIADLKCANLYNGIEFSERNISFKLGVTISNIEALKNKSNNLFYEIAPKTNAISLSLNDTLDLANLYIGYPAVGDYHLKIFTKDGSNLVEEYDIKII
jgi:hypothetical protein